VFVHGRLFQPNLMFAGLSGAHHPRRENPKGLPEWSTCRLGPWIYPPRLDEAGIACEEQTL
jgi:hypothetical protein